MKKILSMILVFAMLLSLPITVFAADGGALPAATEIPLKNGAINNGNNFLQYDPAGADDNANTLFTCDGTYLTPRAGLVSPYSGAAPTNAMLQYRHAMAGDYALSYQVKLNQANADTINNYFYWQDFQDAGRSYLTSIRGVALALKLAVADGNVTVDVIRYTPKVLGKTVTDAVVTGEKTALLLENAEANALLDVSLKWQDRKLTVVVSNAADSAKKNEVTFDLSASQEAAEVMNLVKTRAGFAYLMNVGATAEACTGLGKFTVTDLTQEEAAPVALTLNATARDNGHLFLQYDPMSFSGGDTVVSCDGEWFTAKPTMVNAATGKNSAAAFLQYRYAMKGDYALSYQLKLNESNVDDVTTYFYWQDYVESGRSYQTSQRGTGLAVQLKALEGGKVAVKLLRYNASGLYGLVSGLGEFPILEGAAANAILNVKLEWLNPVVKVTVTNAADPTKTSGELSFDTSTHNDAKAAMNAVKNPAGFGILMTAGADATKCVSVGRFSYIDYESDAPVVDPDYNYPALNPSDYSLLTSGNSFVRGEDGWFTRNTDAVATDNAAIESKHETSYNYKLSFKMKLNAQNTGRVGLWNVWDGKYSGSHYGYMFNLTATAEGQLSYRLARFEGNWSDGNNLVTPATQPNTQDVKILEGQDPGAELLITVTVQDRTLSVDVCLANDPTKKAGTVIYDFSAGSERTVNRIVNRKQGFAIMDMAGQDGLVSASYGAITYTALPGEAPSEGEDTTDYDRILSDTQFNWNGAVDVTADNFLLYTMDGLPQYELFSMENGWLTRKNESNQTQTDGNSYAMAQYKGVMDPSDYKLTFRVKADANNQFRFSVLTRWEDKDDTSMLKFKSQQGYRIYFESTADGMLEIFCYRTGGAGRMAPLPATAGNAKFLNLAGVEAGKLELEVTLVMKDSLIVTEVHLAGDAAKSSGPVAYDTCDDLNLFGLIDRTQGFCLVDSACEKKCAPASFGDFRIYAASAPKIGDDNQKDDDPDDDITTTARPDPDKKPQPDATGEDKPETQGSKPAEEKGCKSGISVMPLFSVLMLSAVAVTVIRKKKED